MNVLNKFKKLVNDPKVQKTVKEKVIPLVKKKLKKKNK